MPRMRRISPEFWYWENVTDCAMATRLLFIGLWNFADDFGVQELKPRTIGMQVFPGDDFTHDQVRAMIDELAAAGLVRVYRVAGQDYVEIVDWARLQRIGARAKRRYPAFASPLAPAGTMPSADDAPLDTPSARPAAAPVCRTGEAKDGEVARWGDAITARLRHVWPDDPWIETVAPADAERWAGRWIEGGCSLDHDVLDSLTRFGRQSPYAAPPDVLAVLDRDIAAGRGHAMRAAA